MRLRALAPMGSALTLLLPVAAHAAWTAPVPLTPPDGAAYAVPQAAVAAGRGAVVWVRAPAGTRGQARVHLATRASARARWSRPRVMSSPGTDAPRVALNARGDAVVAWVSGQRIVAAVRRGPAGAWSQAPVVDAAGGVQETRVTVDRSGRPTVLWSERSGSGFTVKVASRPSARAGWSVRPPRIATPGPAPPAVALSRGGAFVAWTDDDGTRAARTSGGVFESPVELARDVGAPATALSGEGVAVGAWSAALPGGTSVVLAAGRAARADGWGVSDDLGIGMRPVAAINDRGDAVVAWSLDEPGSPQGIEASTRRGARGPWRASTVVARRQCACALAVAAAAVDGRGTALVGWRRDDGALVGGGGVAARPRGALSWERPPVGPQSTARPPAVAADSDAGGVAVWAERGAGGGVRVLDLRP